MQSAPQPQAEPEPPVAPALSVTENLLRIKRSLQSAPSDEQGASAPEGKKPDSAKPSRLEQLATATAAKPVDVETNQQPAQVTDSVQGVEASVPIHQQTENNQAKPTSEPELSPPWDTSEQSEQAVAVEPAIAEQPEQNSVPEPEVAPKVVNFAEVVDADIPAYLGEVKVTKASQLDTWSQLIAQMDIAALTKQLALHSSYQIDGGQVALTLASERAHLLNQNAENQLKEALEKTLGQQIALQIQLGDPINTPYAIQQKVNQMRQQFAEQQVDQDPAIGLLMKTFAASKIEDSIKPR